MKITNIYKKTAALFFLMAAALWPAVEAWGQVTEDRFDETNASVTITHKAAKWFDLRSGISDAAKAMDTFDDETKMFTLQDGTTEVQAAHTYLDTIYVHKGTSVTLEIPDKLGTNYSIKSYQRWHSFRTDGTYRTRNTDPNQVWDLLTPADGISGTSYRYANGYVGYPKGANLYKVNFYVPTDEEFKAWFGEDAAKKYDNNFYLVACDVSSYTDYTKNFDRESSSKSSFIPQSDGNTYEPTLTHRVLFYIVTVDNRDEDPTVTWQEGMGRLKDSAYQGGTLDEGKKYLEEYDISFPYTRVSNHTQELVALSKDAWSYAIPGVSKDADSDTLNIFLQDAKSGITLATTKLTGMTRIIQFNYPNTNTDKTQYVNADNSKATIYVTKTVGGTTYNIARFNLTFIRDTRLLTQTQLEQIEDGTIQNENLKYYQFRTDSYLEQNYQLLTSLNFDYDPAVAGTYGSSSFYPFPLSWTYNSYSFYDGAVGNDFKNSNKYPEWGYYSIMNDFMEGDHWVNGTKNTYAKPLPGSNYHMFIDASDRPGVIARLPFRRKLCKGSELFVTAWLKSAGWSSSMADANMLFSIMGVRTDPVLGTVYEPIYRHSSSQVRRTDYLSGMPGTGNGTNEWMQMYFSFIIDADANYESYVLQIDNNSASTDGGDMYIDDIRVYIATPSAEVKQLEATCTNEQTLMSIKLDWNRLLSRLGKEEGQDEVDAIDFCFIDKAKYDDYLSQYPTDFEGAIESSVVAVGDNTSDSGYNQEYNTLYFNLDFDKNVIYDDKAHPRLAIDNRGTGEYDDKYFFYRTTDESGKKSLAVDFYSDLTPNREYMMLIRINDGKESLSAADFQESVDNVCGINTSFYITAQTLLRVNGQVVDPATDFCAGQIFNFSAQLRVPKQEADGSESYITVDQGVYFDWFFGTQEEFEAPDTDLGVSLRSALTIFREIYPDNEDLTGVEPGQHTVAGTSESIELTENMISVIKKYLEDTGEADGAHNRLVLHKENLDITLLNSGLKLVIQPIPTILPPDGTIDEESWAKVCWNYVPLELNVSGDAPHLQPGFNALLYPSEEFDPSLRIGLKQIRRVSGDGTDNLTINLRKASYVSDATDHLGPLTSRLGMKYLFLIASDDPALADDLDATQGFTQYSLPVGWIDELVAHEYGEDTDYDDNMKIRFDLNGDIFEGLNESTDFKFSPREGYSYTFAIPFEEKLGDNESSSNACFGQFNLTMKVVPEYLVWNDSQTKEAGETIGNWNNDENWTRIVSTRINKNVNSFEDYFTNGTNSTTNGFVPMLFTKVIMPTDSKVELYAAGYTNSDTETAWDTKRPVHIAAPTENIQYDLMAYESGSPLKTERYRVSLLDEIHFEPGAEMKHAEYLLYNKAWVDYQLGKGRWYTLASPLKAVYAGDFYTDKSGTEGSEYFQPIEFNYGTNSTDNDRFSPSVYQRAWKGSAAMMVIGNNQNNEERAIAGNWSALYNDVAEAYTPGTGFSLKVQDITGNNATFRLPKADDSYTYYSYDGQTSGNFTDVSRLEGTENVSGRLQSDQLFIRNTDLTDAEKGTDITITLPETAHGGYYLVGNPFMAHLDMTKFFDETTNSSVLQKKYWVVTDGNQTAAVGTEDGSWVAVDDNSTPTVAPLQSFFVQKAEGVTGDITLTFTQDMQTLGGTTDGLRSANALTITATTTDGRTSRAAVAYDMAASADYEASEDAELFLDSNLGDVPMVYTVAGTMATSINRTSELYNIPLGVYGSKQEMVTLSFGGLNQFSSATLYDAQEQTETPLREGKTVSVPAGTSGRYFLRAGTPTGNEVIARNAFLVYSVGGGKVMVTSSNTPLKDIRVYTMGGAQVRSIQASGMQQEIYLNRGIYLITVSDQDGLQETKKVLVR